LSDGGKSVLGLIHVQIHKIQVSVMQKPIYLTLDNQGNQVNKESNCIRFPNSQPLYMQKLMSVCKQCPNQNQNDKTD
jgi:hypothetical protein